MAPSAPLPRVLLGLPYHRAVEGPFFQSVASLLEDCQRETLRLQVAYAPNTAIHLARDSLVRYFLAGDWDFLVMIDSDQVFHSSVVRRLVAWGKPLVAPVIVARKGPPKPVAYAREGKSLQGDVYYEPLSEEVWAYLSQFTPERLRTASVCLPLTADRPPLMEGLPEAVVAGLGDPLLAVDAVGFGMVCLSREAAEAVDPGPDDRYFDWERGGEDLSFCRRLLAAGYEGFGVGPAKGKGRGIFVDRGALVGHLSEYARGAIDLGRYLYERFDPPPPPNGHAGDLAEHLAEDGARPTPGPWRDEVLPGAAGAPGPGVG